MSSHCGFLLPMLRLYRSGLRVHKTPFIPLAYRNFTSKLDAPPPIKPETPIETALREARDQAILDSLKPPQAPATPEKKPLWDKVKEEASHYWHGLKLLGAETKISSRLLVKLLKGQKLTRREHRQVV